MSGYVVVYLTDCKTQIVVPKPFIRGLSQQNLDNYGKNRNVSYKIFYSKQVCENGVNQDVAPKFNLNTSNQYPPESDETCYKGQIRYIFGE